MKFPLSPEGDLQRAVSLAAKHPSYRTERENGSARVVVEITLPGEWRELDRFRVLLRTERGVEYAADGETVPGDELWAGLRCFLQKQHSGTPAKEWCTPRSIQGKQVFPCKKIHVYDNEHLTANSWYASGRMNPEGVFEVDKEAITARVLSDLGPYVRCPILDLDAVAESIARLPDEINPNTEDEWRYRGSGDVSTWQVSKARKDEEEEVEEEHESLLEKLAKALHTGSVDVGTAVSGNTTGSRNVPVTRYEDIGGMKETIALVREAVELPITHPEIFKRLKIRPHKGILFYGPPGTGKTLLARAVANESGAHFIAISGPEILNKYWGQSEARLRAVFAEAKAKSPSIILFDEIDSFASSRDMMSESFEATLVSQLLSLMDGMNDLGRVSIIATTNRPEALDSALRRPGRFDHEIEIGLPDKEARRHILNIHTRGMPISPDLDLDEISGLTRDYSGADLEALCREAALVCMRRSLNLADFKRRLTSQQLSAISITTEDFQTAMLRVGASVHR